MLCRDPYLRGKAAYPCGRCEPCRVSRQKIWAHRIMLEAQQHEKSSFVTLTYSDENLPASGSLDAKHLQLFLKRIRKSVEPEKLRFFAVGEYGGISWRPHYHLALFNYPTCLYGQTSITKRGSRCCAACSNLETAWGYGIIQNACLEVKSAQYIAGYVTKKLTNRNDLRLHQNGNILEPEFARMSLRPGIGHNSLHDVASVLLQYDLENKLPDVPSALRHGTGILPLGRYLRRQLRTLVGKPAQAPQSTLDEITENLRPLYESSRATPSLPSEVKSTLFKNALFDEGAQKVLNRSTKRKLFKSRRPL